MKIDEKFFKKMLYEMFSHGIRVGQGYNQKTIDEFFETYYKDLDHKKLDWLMRVVVSAQKLIRCKGRYHAELNYKSLEEVVKEEPK